MTENEFTDPKNHLSTTPEPNKKPAAKPTNKRYTLHYDATLGRVYGIWFINLLLTILTIGIYSFWGKTRMRRYIASSFTLENDRFEYTGTGGELLKGFLLALPVFLLVYIPYIIWDPQQNPLINLMILPILYLVYVGTYAALRYRMSRTIWRGVRGKLGGSAFQYGKIGMVRMLLNILTLGIIVPYSDMKLHKYVADHAHFGSAKARFDSSAKPLMKIHLITLLLAIPTAFISRFWYAAALKNYTFSHTHIHKARLHANYTGGSLAWLYIGNAFIILLTLTLGTPIAIQRNMRYLEKRVSFAGEIDTTSILQSDEALKRSGEGISEAFGLDAGFV